MCPGHAGPRGEEEAVGQTGKRASHGVHVQTLTPTASLDPPLLSPGTMSATPAMATTAMPVWLAPPAVESSPPAASGVAFVAHTQGPNAWRSRDGVRGILEWLLRRLGWSIWDGGARPVSGRHFMGDCVGGWDVGHGSSISAGIPR
jgi:hypothetical protein